MDQIKAKNVKVVEGTIELLKADLPGAVRRDSDLTVLDEWEMVLASGGEPAVCW